MCAAPTIELGCGPARLVARLIRRGIPALGIDRSATAIRLAGRGGAPALLSDVFEPLPGMGHWQTVLLVDGNIGLGGDPRRILGRAAELLCHGGRCVAEFDTEAIGIRARWVRLAVRSRRRAVVPLGIGRCGQRRDAGRPGRADARRCPPRRRPGDRGSGVLVSTPRFRSPLRGPWLTSVFGLVLLVTLPIVIITGLLSYIAYEPQLGQAIPAHVGWLRLPDFSWPTRPSWLYRLTQGLHVGLGLLIIPVVLAKLWSVIPRLFVWPPARSLAQLLERASVAMLVGGILFEIITGVLNIQYDYIFGFSFYTGHYFGAWVFIAGFLLHIAVKIPGMIAGLRSLPMREVLRTNVAGTRPEPRDPDGLVADNPDEPTMSRRGALALVSAGVLLIGVLTAGQTLGGVTRKAALLLPRGRIRSPVDFPINKTAARRRDHAGGHRRELAVDPARRPLGGGAGPRHPGGHAATHRAAADRLRGRVVDRSDLERGAAGRVGAQGRCTATKFGAGDLPAARRRLRRGPAGGQSGR